MGFTTHDVDYSSQLLSTAAKLSTASIDLLAAEVRELRRVSEELRRENRRQSRRVDQMVHRVGSFLEYSKGFNTTLIQMFTNYGFSSGMGLVQFSTTPVFSDLSDDSADNMDVVDPK